MIVVLLEEITYTLHGIGATVECTIESRGFKISGKMV